MCDKNVIDYQDYVDKKKAAIDERAARAEEWEVEIRGQEGEEKRTSILVHICERTVITTVRLIAMIMLPVAVIAVFIKKLLRL